MSKMYYTDQMFLFIKEHCSDNLIDKGLKTVDLVSSDNNKWDITDFVTEENECLTIVDKLNLVWCFLNNNGAVIFKKNEYKQDRQSFLMTELSKDEIVNQKQEADILVPWIDCTEGDPFFELEKDNC